jgi:hypothetical protein
MDGRLQLDAGAGRLRTEDGQRYNQAVIQSGLPSNSRKPTAHTGAIGKNL